MVGATYGADANHLAASPVERPLTVTYYRSTAPPDATPREFLRLHASIAP